MFTRDELAVVGIESKPVVKLVTLEDPLPRSDVTNDVTDDVTNDVTDGVPSSAPLNGKGSTYRYALVTSAVATELLKSLQAESKSRTPW